MIRNMEQTANTADLKAGFQLSSNELLRLIEMVKSGTVGCISYRFQIWLCIGRQSRKESRENEAAKRKQNQRIRIKGADNSVPIIFSCKFRINMVYVKCEYLIIAS